MSQCIECYSVCTDSAPCPCCKRKPARIHNARIERAQHAVDEALRDLPDTDERIELYREKCRVALDNLKMPESKS